MSIDTALPAEETAREIMEHAARNVSPADIKRIIGGREDLSDLTDDEYEQYVSAVSDAIDGAGIEITF